MAEKAEMGGVLTQGGSFALKTIADMQIAREQMGLDTERLRMQSQNAIAELEFQQKQMDMQMKMQERAAQQRQQEFAQGQELEKQKMAQQGNQFQQGMQLQRDELASRERMAQRELDIRQEAELSALEMDEAELLDSEVTTAKTQKSMERLANVQRQAAAIRAVQQIRSTRNTDLIERVGTMMKGQFQVILTNKNNAADAANLALSNLINPISKGAGGAEWWVDRAIAPFIEFGGEAVSALVGLDPTRRDEASIIRAYTEKWAEGNVPKSLNVNGPEIVNRFVDELGSSGWLNNAVPDDSKTDAAKAALLKYVDAMMYAANNYAPEDAQVAGYAPLRDQSDAERMAMVKDAFKEADKYFLPGALDGLFLDMETMTREAVADINPEEGGAVSQARAEVVSSVLDKFGAMGQLHQKVRPAGQMNPKLMDDSDKLVDEAVKLLVLSGDNDPDLTNETLAKAWGVLDVKTREWFLSQRATNLNDFMRSLREMGYEIKGDETVDELATKVATSLDTQALNIQTELESGGQQETSARKKAYEKMRKRKASFLDEE